MSLASLDARCALPVLALLAALAPERAAHAEKVSRVGVVVYLSVNVDSAQGSELASRLGDAVRKTLSVDVVAGDEVSRRLPPSGVPEDCLVSAGCIRDIGRRLDADQLLFLVIARVGSRVQIDSTWADVSSGRTLPRDAISFEDGSASDTVFTNVAPKLLPDAPRRGGREVARGTDSRRGGRGGGSIERGLGPGAAPGPTITGPVVVAVGVGGAALVGGFALAVGTRDDYDALVGVCTSSDPRVRRACGGEKLESLEDRSLFANILFGVAAMAGVTAVTFYLSSGSSGTSPSLAIAPTGDGFDVSVEGRF